MSGTVRILVQLAFAYTCIEGFIVNITYPNIATYLIKDAIIALAYFALVTEQRPSIGSLRKLGAPVLIFSALMLFFLLMPSPASVVARLVALKQHLFYIPLMYVGYFFTRSESDAYTLVRLMAWTSIPTSLFGIYLFFAGPQALRALGGSYSAVVYSTAGATGSIFWRVPGTFTSPGQYSLYLLIQAVVMTGVLFMPRLVRGSKALALTALALAIGALLASGTRTPLVVYVLCVGLGMLYMGRLTRMGTAALIVYGIVAVAFTYFGAGVQDRVGSVLSEENYERFRTTAFGQLFLQQVTGSPLGLGLGSATIAGRHFTDFSKLIFVESYFGVIGAETGIFGLFVCLWLMARVSWLIIASRVAVRRAEWSPLWIFLALVILEIIALMPSSAMIESSPGNMYFWFLIGMVVRFVDLERARQWAAVTLPARQPSGAAPQYAYYAPR